MNIIDYVKDVAVQSGNFEVLAIVDCDHGNYAPVFKPVFFTKEGKEYGLFFIYGNRIPKKPLEGLIPNKVFSTFECRDGKHLTIDTADFDKCSLYLWDTETKQLQPFSLYELNGSSWYEEITEYLSEIVNEAFITFKAERKSIVPKYVWENFITKDLKPAKYERA